MIIDTERCIGCALCIPYCVSGALSITQGRAEVDDDACVECENCVRSFHCPTDAIERTELKWPRSLRSLFSNPLTVHRLTGVPGRGTEEMKTNDVTGRYRLGEVGFVIEVGRPGVGATIGDAERISLALGRLGAEFEPDNPFTALMVDRRSGKVRKDVKKERVLSAIIEFRVVFNCIKEVIEVLRKVKVETSFSVGIISRVDTQQKELLLLLDRLGTPARPNGKVNIGLGRRPAQEAIQ